MRLLHLVTPAKAGVQARTNWIPAYAGMTNFGAAKDLELSPALRLLHLVSPAKAGVRARSNWIPAYAGMTNFSLAGETTRGPVRHSSCPGIEQSLAQFLRQFGNPCAELTTGLQITGQHLIDTGI